MSDLEKTLKRNSFTTCLIVSIVSAIIVIGLIIYMISDPDIIVGIGILIAAFVGGYSFYLLLTNGQVNDLSNELAKHSLTIKDLEADLATGEQWENYRISKNYILNVEFETDLIFLKDVVLMFPEQKRTLISEVRQRPNTNPEWFVTYYTHDRLSHKIELDREDKCREFIDEVKKFAPYIEYRYNWSENYPAELPQIIETVDNRREIFEIRGH